MIVCITESRFTANPYRIAWFCAVITQGVSCHKHWLSHGGLKTISTEKCRELELLEWGLLATIRNNTQV